MEAANQNVDIYTVEQVKKTICVNKTMKEKKKLHYTKIEMISDFFGEYIKSVFRQIEWASEKKKKKRKKEHIIRITGANKYCDGSEKSHWNGITRAKCVCTE